MPGKWSSHALAITVSILALAGCNNDRCCQCPALEPTARTPIQRPVDEQAHASGIVRIRTGDGCGTGFIVGYDERSRVATVFTCGHVVGKAKQCSVEFNSPNANTGENPTAAAEVRFSAVDGTRDNAELGCVVPKGIDVHVFGIAATVPDRGWSLGHPRCGWLVGVPIQRRQEDYQGGIIPIAPAHHRGSSGSPVFDDHGNVAGVVTFTTQGTKSPHSLIVPISQFLAGPQTVSATQLPKNVKRLGEINDEATPKNAAASPAAKAVPTEDTPRRKSPLVPRSN